MASNESFKYKLTVVEGTELQLSLNGAQGPTGPANTLSIGTVTTGETGTPAAATITGSAPEQTLNLTLPKGNTGTAATIAVGTTTTGNAGTSASVTNSGTSGAAVFNFTIPRGDTGATGATGPKGDTGDAGADALWNFIGEWVSDGSGGWAEGDVVTYEGQLYYCTQYYDDYPNEVDYPPSSGLRPWQLIAAKGDTGATGTAATIDVGTTTTGNAGTSASVTNSGTSSAAVFNFTIPRGDTGATGATGTAATVAVGTTTTGNAGTSASVTNSGTSSAAVFDFTIPRGDTGATGAAATIAVGTTTTGNAGTSASVTNSGTSSAAIFDFTIPRGDTGATGPEPSLTIADNSNTSITLSDSNNNTVIRCTASSAVTITVPSTLSSGFSCMVIQAGTGTVTFAAGSGATINSFGGLLATAGQHASASLIRVASATYNLSGNLL